MPPVNTKEKMALHLVLRPSDLSTAGVKDKELFIHNTLHRGSTDRTSVKKWEERRGQQKRYGIKKKTQTKVQGMERERKRKERKSRWLVGLCIKGRTIAS